MQKQLRHSVLIVCIAIVTTFGNGCASPASSRGMQASPVTIPEKYPFTVSVQAEGGKKTHALGTSEISSDSFAKAVSDSISRSRMFRAVVAPRSADYSLQLQIIKVAKPTQGFDMTATMTVGWRLTDIATGKVVFLSLITKSYTATFGDALVAIKRLRLAQEGAARENIEAGLRRISRLNLNGGE